MPDWRPALIALVPGVVLMQSWLRLEHPQRDGARALLLLLLAAIPAVVPRLWQRLALLAVTTVAAVDIAARVPVLHPWRALTRFWNGFLDFYEVQLPFNPTFHPWMHALMLLAGFGFTAMIALAAASRRPLLAVGALVVGACWPATLLQNDRDFLRGAVVLATSLFLLAALRLGAARTVWRASLLGAGLLVAAVAATTQPAVAKSEFLHWQTWTPYTRPVPAVGVRYVWNANYDGFTWPRKTTTVLKVHAPPRSVYWRATTLDVFNGTSWVEYLSPVHTHLFDGRLDLTQNDPLVPAAARDPTGWRKVEVEVEALKDNHLVAPSVPVGYSLFSGAQFWQGGTGTLPRELEKGEQYDAWSYSPQPTPRELAASKPNYPPAALAYLELNPGINAPPPFGTPGRAAIMKRFLAIYSPYRALYEQARRVVGNGHSPYAAALALESWLRTTGGFTYTTHPPHTGPDPLLDFVVRTKRGYCQHYAGAMALMLRYLGIPARVAEGFVSGAYDNQTHTWTVTDHDAHAWVEVWFDGYGWLPFDPTPGRGYLSAAYSISSPQFRASAAAGIVGGAAATLLNTAAIHQDLSFGDKAVGFQFLGTDIRKAKPTPGGIGLQHRGGSLGKLLALVLGLAIALLAVAKAIRRHARYATPDPRQQAAACRADLRDFLADQGIRVAPSDGPDGLVSLLRSRLEIDARPFAAALAAARFGPPADAKAAAATARAELTRLRAQLRGRLGLVRRARGLVSLRSLGFAA